VSGSGTSKSGLSANSLATEISVRAKYHSLKSGENFRIPIVKKGTAAWVIKCCGCGLIHVVLMKPSKRWIHTAVWRHDDLAKLLLPKDHVKGSKKGVK